MKGMARTRESHAYKGTEAMVDAIAMLNFASAGLWVVRRKRGNLLEKKETLEDKKIRLIPQHRCEAITDRVRDVQVRFRMVASVGTND